MRPDRQIVAPINPIALSRNASCIRMACACQVKTARAGLDGKLITPTRVDCGYHWPWGTWTVPPGRLTLGGEWFGPCRRTAVITSTADRLLHWPFPHLDRRNFQSTSLARPPTPPNQCCDLFLVVELHGTIGWRLSPCDSSIFFVVAVSHPR